MPLLCKGYHKDQAEKALEAPEASGKAVSPFKKETPVFTRTPHPCASPLKNWGVDCRACGLLRWLGRG